MSRESLLVLLDNMKDRMNCLETRSKIEETSLDTLKQNMEKIESKFVNYFIYIFI
jgi:hypothetical protein